MEQLLPKLSATMDEGTIVEWRKREGDPVREGEILYLLETDKTTLDVESTVTGVLEKILVDVHTTVPTGIPVCLIRTGEEKEVSISPETMEGSGQDRSGEERLKVSPAARKLAQELRVDLVNVTGTGPNGRISIKDIEDAAQKSGHDSADAQPLTLQSTAPSSSEKITSAKEASSQPPQRKKASSMRSAIAKSMTSSWITIPAFWVEKWVRTDNLLKTKELLKQSRNEECHHLTVTDFLLQAVGFALSEMPNVNVRWIEDGQIEQIAGFNVGLAISLDEGLVAPILPGMNQSLSEIAKARSELVEAVRANKPYVTGIPAAITISNMGQLGIDRFRAIVKPDESMILAVGRMEERVLSEGGEVVIRKGFSLILSADHRAIDGSVAAIFLARVCEIIENGSWKYV